MRSRSWLTAFMRIPYCSLVVAIVGYCMAAPVAVALEPDVVVPSIKPGLWRVDQGDSAATNYPSLPDIAMRLCVTPAMIARGRIPASGQLGRPSCSSTVTTRSATATVYESRCTVRGANVSEVMEVSEDGNSIITTIAGQQAPDDSNSSLRVHFRTRMSYLGPECLANYAPPKEDRAAYTEFELLDRREPQP
jgi:Protein of unknown function (DUF3617)